MLENLDKKKIFIILMVLLVAALIVVFLYFIWRQPPDPVNPPSNQNVNVGTFPNVNLGNVNVGGPEVNVNLPPITTIPGQPTGPVTDPVSPVASGGLTDSPQAVPGLAQFPVATSSGTRYYNPSDGKFYELSPSGPVALNDIPYRDAQNITWSQDGRKAVLEFPDSSNIVYDFASKKQFTLPQEMTEFSFSANTNEVAGKFLGEQESDKWLVTVNSTGSSLKGIEPLGDNADKVEVNWSPQGQVVALSRTGEALGLFNEEVLLIGLQGENFRSLEVEGRGFQSQWAPSGNQLVYSIYSDRNNYKPELWVVDGSVDKIGYGKKNLGLPTWADKCTVTADSNAAYCAVPQNLPDGAGYLRDLARGLPDSFYRVDLQTGSSTLIATPVANSNYVSASNLTMSADGKTLYFIDEITGSLRSLRLAP